MAIEQTPPAGEFNLATLLNILWRRRLIVLGLPMLGLIVGIAYGVLGTKRWSATANIRPGITSFSPAGEPFRQWQLKDITTWYDKMMYRTELNRRLGLPRDSRPVIKSEFIATGLTNLAGGEVVTLWTTGTSPEMAAAIIDTSIAMFQQYAESDTLSSQIKLTRDGLRLQVDVLRTRLMTVDKREAGLNLDLESARAESLIVSVMDQELGFELEKLQEKRDFFSRRVEKLDEDLPALERDLNQVETVLADVATGPGPEAGQAIDPESIPRWARRDAVLDGGDVLGGLAEIRLRLQNERARNLALQDSFRYEMQVTALEFRKREIKREATVESKLRDIEKKIGDLELEREYELPVKRQEIRNDINSRLIQMGTLAPLQRVGDTLVSEKPVRPRGKRATLILVFLGLIGGVTLGFVWDYLASHRQEILKP